MFYYYKKEQIQQGKLFCVYQSNTKLTGEEINNINTIQDNLLQDTIVYESNYPFVGYPILDGDIIRPATVVELIQMGMQELQDGEYIENGELKKINRPSYQYEWDKSSNVWRLNENKLFDGQYIENNQIKEVVYDRSLGYIKPIWDKQLKQWAEGATDCDKARYDLAEIEKLNNYLDCEDMRRNGVFDDYVSYRDSLKSIISNMSVGILSLSLLPTPSEKLSIYFETNNIKIK